MLLDEFASRCWQFLPVTKKTIQNYRGAYNRNISKSLGSKELHAISKREFVEALAALTPQNYFQTLMTMRVIYREAIARELVIASPVATIKAPRIHVEPKKFLTWEEVRETNFGKYDTHIKFLALHGLRWGEAVALRESDIHDEKVHINKSMYGPTKTPAGVRQVPYFGYFKKFPSSRTAVANTLQKYGVTIHSLRKTYAYFLKTSDVHVTTAAKFMGHSNPLVTLKIYTMVRDDETDVVGQKLRLLLGQEN
ncbi:MAG: tyrosine-type recombinase/integrase [Actinobacteria bacterium]|nr:tyrosine-type recombinase/integrase [Actinomycetota bacterium]